MRYFIEKEEDKPIKLAFLPSDPHYSWMVWLHFKDGVIERWEATRNGEKFSEMKELTEQQAREYDPQMFSECLDRHYADYPSMLQFYIQRAQECVDFEPAQDQVERYLTKELGYEMGGPMTPMSISIMAITLGKMQDFGVISHNKTNVYIIDKDTVKYVSESPQLQKWIASDMTCLLWWRYNTLEKNLTSEVFNDRMRRL